MQVNPPNRRLLPLLFCFWVLSAPGARSATLGATVNLDAGVTLNTFAPVSVFGVNVGNWIGKTDYQDVRPRIQEAGNYFLRFPGGSNGDDYHWNGTGSFDGASKWVPDPASFSPGFSGSLKYRGTTSSYGIPSLVTDGNPTSYWLSCAETDFPDKQWLYVDLGSNRSPNSVTIVWGTPYATRFAVQYYPTWAGTQWAPYQNATEDWQATSASNVTGVGGTQGVTFGAVTTRYLRILMTASSAAPAQYSIAELYVYQGATQLTQNRADVPTPNQPAQSWTAASSTDPASTSGYVPSLDFETFMAYARSFGPPATPIVGVNFGSGTPQEAAAWVHYANVVKGYGIKYWQIGNEMEGTWETGGPLNTRDYVRRYLAFYDAMKAEDPSIVVTGPVAGGATTPSVLYNGHTVIQDFAEFLHAAGRDDALDALDFHWYPNWGAYTDAQAFASAAQMDGLPATFQSWLAVNPLAADVPVLLTEFNSDAGDQNFQVRLADALWTADVYGRYIRGFGPRALTNFFVALGGGTGITTPAGGDLGYLQVQPGPYQYQEHATYWAMKLLTHAWARPGDASPHALVSASSDQGQLPVYADYRPDGILSLMVLNEDPSNSYSATLHLSNFNPNATALGWRFDASNYAWVTTGGTPYHADPDTAPATFLQTGVTGAFPVTFGPYSLTVLQFTNALLPTATVTATPTITATPTPTATVFYGSVTLIDDFEDPGREGVPPARANLWGGPWETSIDPTSAISVAYGAPGAFGTSRAAHVGGLIAVSPTPGWSNFDTNLYGGYPPPPFNAASAGFVGIQFWYYGDGAVYRVCAMSTAVTDFNYYGYDLTPPAGQWTFVQIPFSSMTRQAGWGTQTGLPAMFGGGDFVGVQFKTQGSGGAFAYGVDQLALYDASAIATPGTPQPTGTPTPSRTPSPSPTPTATLNPSLIPTSTATPTVTPTATITPTGTATASVFGAADPVLWPNPVKYGDTVKLSLSLPEKGTVRVVWFTPSNRRIGEWSKECAAGPQDLSLPLSDGRGKPLANGLYYLKMDGPDASGILKLVILR